MPCSCHNTGDTCLQEIALVEQSGVHIVPKRYLPGGHRFLHRDDRFVIGGRYNREDYHPKKREIQLLSFPWKIFPPSLAFRTSSTV